MGNSETRSTSSQPPLSTVRPPTKDIEFVDEVRIEKKIVTEDIPVVGVVAIGVGQRLTHLLRILLAQYGGGKQAIIDQDNPQKGGFIEIRAICDESSEAIKDHISSLSWIGIPDISKVPQFTDYKELFASDIKFDWVLIGSKNYLHREHCVEAFKHGKNVFCEKPLATSIEDCEAIRIAHEKSNKLFATGFVLRHAPFYNKINEILRSNILGKIISVEANETLTPSHGGYIMRNWRRHREETGPHILEKCCHDIDILNWLIDSLPQKVSSFGGLDIFKPENNPKDDKLLRLYNLWGAYEDINAFESDKDTEDNQVCIMEYKNGTRVTFHTNCCTAYPQRSLKFYCVNGTLKGDLLKGTFKYKIISNSMNSKTFKSRATDMHGGADEKIVDDLVDSIRDGTVPRAGGEEGFRSALVCLCLDKARIEGTVVDMGDIWKQFNVDK